MSSHPILEVERHRSISTGRVLAGYHLSAGSELSIDWAAHEASARRSSLRIAGSTADPMSSDMLQALRARNPELTIDLANTDSPIDDLLGDADQADLFVLAVTEGESAGDILHGSLARRALRRSPCPVIVVRGRTEKPIRHIVVGVDGSNAASAALDWACDEANIHGAELVVIHAREGDIGRAEAGCVLDLAVNECRERMNGPVRGVLAEGSPVKALVVASRVADMIAVGSRGRSGFRTALFGSVALSVAEHADCPVAVTHPRVRLD